jgi:Secretion system C-terminal sorting domain
VKQYILSFLVFAAVQFTQAQIKFIGGDTLYQSGFADPTKLYVAQGNLQNLGKKTITINWYILDSTMPQGWEYSGVCDPNLCYPLDLGVVHSFTLDSNAKALMKADVNSHCIPGNGSLKVRMWDVADSNNTAFNLVFNFSMKKNVAICGNPAAITDIDPARISLYPNPVHRALELRLPQALDNGKVEVFSLIGSKVYEKYLKDNDASPSLDLNTLDAGIYMCRVYDDGRLIATKRFTKD